MRLDRSLIDLRELYATPDSVTGVRGVAQLACARSRESVVRVRLYRNMFAAELDSREDGVDLSSVMHDPFICDTPGVVPLRDTQHLAQVER